jgi:hypothetical protein
MISVGVGRIRADPTHMGRTFPEQSWMEKQRLQYLRYLLWIQDTEVVSQTQVTATARTADVGLWRKSNKPRFTKLQMKNISRDTFAFNSMKNAL